MIKPPRAYRPGPILLCGASAAASMATH